MEPEVAPHSEDDLREQAIGGWGIGLAANAWDVYGRQPISEAEIQRESERLRG